MYTLGKPWTWQRIPHLGKDSVLLIHSEEAATSLALQFATDYFAIEDLVALLCDVGSASVTQTVEFFPDGSKVLIPLKERRLQAEAERAAQRGQ